MTIEEKAREIFVIQDYMECESASDEAWMKRDAFQRGAEWIIEKATEWLTNNKRYLDDISSFKKAMQGNKDLTIGLLNSNIHI